MLQNIKVSFFLVLLTFYSFSQGSKVNIDSLLASIKKYSTENPEITAINCNRLFLQVKQNPSDSLKALYHLAMGEYKSGLGITGEALSHVDSAISISQSKRNQALYVDALLKKSALLQRSGNYSEAIKVNEKARLVALKGKNNRLLIQSLLLRGDIYKEIGQYNDALSKKGVALAIAKKYEVNIAECNQSIGSVHWNFGNYSEALKSYFEALIAAEKAKDTLRIIQVLKNIGLTYRETGDFDKSLSHLNNAIQLANKVKLYDEVADILNILGGVYLKFSQPAKAIDYYTQSLHIKESLGFKQSSINTLNNIAKAYLMQKSNAEAIEALNKALELSKEIGDPLTEASIQNELGNTFLSIENYPEALRRYLLSLKIRQSYGKEEDIARTLVNISLVYRKLGLFRNAQKYIDEAMGLVENLEVKPDLKIYIYQNLGNVYYDQKQYANAINAYQKALELSEKKGDDLQVTRILKNIAQTYLDWNKPSKARSTITQAIKIALRSNQNQVLSDLYNTLGNIERHDNNLDLALTHYITAKEKYRQNLNADGEALCLRKIGEIHSLQGRYKDAKANVNQSIRIGKSVGNPYLVLFGTLALSDIEKAQGKFQNALTLYQRYVYLKDSIEEAKRSEANIDAHINLELDKTKTEIKLFEAEVDALRAKVELDRERINKQKAQRNFLITAVFFLLFIALGVFYLFNQKKNLARLQREKYEEEERINQKLKQYQAELEQTIKTKDKLFSIVAHDLRSPFTALVGLSEILATKADELSPSEVKEFSNHIHQSASNVLALTENLLSWARSQTGKLTLNPSYININELISKATQVASLPASEKGINIETSCDQSVTAFADYDTLLTIIRNLLSNAIKFTPSGGKISVMASSDNQKVIIQVTDTGVGIAPENLSNLFRLDGFTTKGTNSESGTGLGLMLCKEFAEANGGTIGVSSTLGKGTTFTITLPSKNVAYDQKSR